MYCFCKVYSIHLHNNDVAFHDLIAFLSSEYSQSALLPAFFMHEKKSLIEGLIYYICFFAKFQVSLHISSSVFSATHPNCSFARVGSA